MGYYFDDTRSLWSYEGADPKAALSALAHRYMGQNLKHGLYMRAYTNDGIVRTTDYRYLADLNKIFPDAKEKECVWAFAKLWFDGESSFGYDINCFGPMTMYMNGEVVYKSDLFKERYSETSTRVFINAKPGWNDIRVRFQKTKAGFGGHFGTWIGKWDQYVLMPTAERDGREGWIFTEPVSPDYVPECYTLGMSEADFDVKVYPDTAWDDSEKAMGQMQRMYGLCPGGYAVGWSRMFFDEIGTHTYEFELDAKSPAAVIIDGKEVYKTEGGVSKFEVELPFGEYDVLVRSDCGDGWGYSIKRTDGTPFKSGARCKGTADTWVYIGPFDGDFCFPAETALDLKHVVGEPKRYWRLDERNTYVRPYNENTLYGRWNYPLGVTMYGLLHAARILGSDDMLSYIKDHVQLCCDTLEYALWDKEQYGGATSIHNLLTSIDSLDDCGSFASMMLEVNKYMPLDGVEKVADYVGDYIFNHQARLEDGTFFRKEMMHHFHNMTMWADDLYMSVPFLVRYSKFKNDPKYINDAARQFFGFKKRLFMPEEQIMSHVYDFKYDSKTNVPWGRGNGWVVFSMTELLAELPDDHELKGDLIEFLNTLCEGYLRLQDPEGMWHQVINEWDSYPETSCTSMFIYAFSRGIRYGWLRDPEKYVRAIYKGWEAITKTSVDANGNVYGVCRGSEFSFISDYYKYELGWNLNDTHGTGIVMLAGIEVIRLGEFLKQ